MCFLQTSRLIEYEGMERATVDGSNKTKGQQLLEEEEVKKSLFAILVGQFDCLFLTR